MSDRAPYSRIYWSVMDDEKFISIYNDDGAFSLWVRLLMGADALWPAAAPMPRSARKRHLDVLVGAGVVDLLPADRYRIHGLDAERGRRASAARRDPDGTQLGPKREATGSLAKPSQAENETSQAEPARDPADIYWSLTGKYAVDRTLSWVDELTAQFGAEPTIRAIVQAHTQDRSTKTLLGRSQDILRAEARQLDRKEAAEEQARLKEKRAQPRVEEAWRAEFRAAIEEQYRGLDAA